MTFFTNETERGVKTGLTAAGDLGRAWSSVVDIVGVAVGGPLTGPSLLRNSKVSSLDDGLVTVGVVVGRADDSLVGGGGGGTTEVGGVTVEGGGGGGGGGGIFELL